MEISFPFAEDYPSSNLFSFVHDQEPSIISLSSTNKRPRIDESNDFGYNVGDELTDEFSFQDLVSKLLGFDDTQLEEKLAPQTFRDSEQNPQFMSNDTQVEEKPAPQTFVHSEQNPQFIFSNFGQEMEQSGNVLSFAQSQDCIFNGYDGENSRPAKRVRSGSDEFATTTLDESNNSVVSQRRLWVKTRSKAWWEHVNSPDFSEAEFKNAFRMSKATFDMLCNELESVLIKKDTSLRLAIPVRQRVAVCIWRLATGEALREVSKRFGLGISTCHKLVLEVCMAIRTVLMPKFLHWPNENRMREIKQEFEFASGIPNVGGAIYTTHIPIVAPKANVAAYFNQRHTERNQKTSYSITVQGVVDPKGAFTDILVGLPGSMTDDQVLEKSSIYQRANRGAMKDTWVIGNKGFPLMDWLLVPFTDHNLTWTRHALNQKVDEVQAVAKQAFMRLKARWSCLQKRTEMKLQDLPVVIGACCVLHNICEMRNEGLNPELNFELFDDEMVAENNFRSVNAVQARNQIAHKILHVSGTNLL